MPMCGVHNTHVSTATHITIIINNRMCAVNYKPIRSHKRTLSYIIQIWVAEIKKKKSQFENLSQSFSPSPTFKQP